MERPVSTIPAPFAHLLAAWNERDPARIRHHVEQAVTADIAFTDPQYAIRGVDAFVAMVQEFRKRLPQGPRRAHERGRPPPRPRALFLDRVCRCEDARGRL